MEKKKVLIACFLTVSFFAVLPIAAQAAGLYFSPSSRSHTIGDTFSVAIYVSSADQSMNAASGVISFPRDKLSVSSISKAGTIFSQWVKEPSYSNSSGVINFEGIALNPGYTGSSGKILTINFKAKAAGAAALDFSNGSVLANDGKGTNILTSLKGVIFSLGKEAPSVPEATTPGIPPAPKISSGSHPDPNKWYSENTAKFSWSKLSDITAVRILVDKNSQTIPTVYYSPPVSSKELSDIEDGVWYFHVRLKNNFGWGGISHFRFQIDTEKPSHFEISEIERDDKTNPKVKFVFDAKDETSGIDHYEVKIDSGDFQTWKVDSEERQVIDGTISDIFETPVLKSGEHLLIAKAIDKAGNLLMNSVEFTVESIDVPIIKKFPKELTIGENLFVSGSTYSNAKVTLWLEKRKQEAKSYAVKADKDGDFTFITDEKLEGGVYELRAKATDMRGAESGLTEKLTILVKRPAFIKIGSWAISFLAVVIPLIALIFFLFGIIYYGWYKFLSFKRKIRKEATEADKALHKAFDLLKDEIQKQIKLLERTGSKRKLTKEENKIIKQLKKDLNDAEKFVRKEIKDIEKITKK